MGCYNCKYLKINDKKDGNINGSVYYCNKIKKQVRGSDEECEKYEKDVMRKTYESDEIYLNGKKYMDGCDSIATYLFIAIMLFIIAIVVNN